MLALTFSTGVIDAVGYLGLDRVFTGNMTGNVVILGMALAGADDLPIAGPLIALVAFMAGAAVAGRLSRAAATGWVATTPAMLGLVALLMLGLAAYLFAVPEPGFAIALVVTGLLGLAMGIQAGAARHIGVKDVTTVVVTSTITGLAADSVLGNGKGSQVSRRGAAIVLILAGACVGAFLLRWGLAPGLLLTGAITTVVAVIGHADARRALGRAHAAAAKA